MQKLLLVYYYSAKSIWGEKMAAFRACACKLSWALLGSSFRPPGFSPYMGREETRVQGLDYCYFVIVLLLRKKLPLAFGITSTNHSGRYGKIRRKTFNLSRWRSNVGTSQCLNLLPNMWSLNEIAYSMYLTPIFRLRFVSVTDTTENQPKWRIFSTGSSFPGWISH